MVRSGKVNTFGHENESLIKEHQFMAEKAFCRISFPKENAWREVDICQTMQPQD